MVNAVLWESRPACTGQLILWGNFFSINVSPLSSNVALPFIVTCFRLQLPMEKKQHVHLTIQEKNKLVQYAHETQRTRNQLTEWVSTNFKKKVHPTTVSRIVKDHKIQPTASSSSIRRSEVSFPEFETLLHEWFIRTEKQINLSDDLVITKAQELRSNLKIPEGELKLSNGWLQKFKKRNGIKSYYVHGESGSVDIEAIRNELDELKSKISQYNRMCIISTKQVYFTE